MSKSDTSKAAAQQTSQVQENRQTLNVGDQVYDLAQLSEQARQLVVNVQAAEHELGELNRKTAIAQTAHAAYMNALNEVLPAPIETGAATEAEKPAAADKKSSGKSSGKKKK